MKNKILKYALAKGLHAEIREDAVIFPYKYGIYSCTLTKGCFSVCCTDLHEVKTNEEMPVAVKAANRVNSDFKIAKIAIIDSKAGAFYAVPVLSEDFLEETLDNAMDVLPEISKTFLMTLLRLSVKGPENGAGNENNAL